GLRGLEERAPAPALLQPSAQDALPGAPPPGTRPRQGQLRRERGLAAAEPSRRQPHGPGTLAPRAGHRNPFAEASLVVELERASDTRSVSLTTGPTSRGELCAAEATPVGDRGSTRSAVLGRTSGVVSTSKHVCAIAPPLS